MSDGWAFACTALVVAAVVVLLFGALYPNLVPSTLNEQWNVTIYNASSTPYTLKIMTWVTAFFAPLTVVYQAWTYWVFRQRISAERIPPVDRSGEASVLSTNALEPGRPLDPRLWRASTALRRFLVGAVGCGVVISGCAIGSAVVLAGVVARVITDPSTRSLHACWLGSLSILLALWAVRALTHWLQARLGQRGASAVIADLNGQVLAAVTARQPSELAAQRDAAAIVVTRGLDGLRPYFTGYLPTLLLAAILTPATVAVIALYDLKSTAIVAITLPLIPVFMVLIGLATAERSAAALAAMSTLQARLLDLIAGIPTLRALGRAVGSGAPHRRTRRRPSAFGDRDAADRVPVGAGARIAGHAGRGAGGGQYRSSPGVRRDEPGRGFDRAAAGAGCVLATASHRRGIPCRSGR